MKNKVSVSIAGQALQLSPKEYELLFYMVRNRGIARTRERLIAEVWGYDFYGDDRTLDTHICGSGHAVAVPDRMAG